MEETVCTTQVHPTAILDPEVELGEGVAIGPYAVITGNARIGDRTQIGPHVVIESNTTVGKDCKISAGTALGGPPQDYHFKGEKTFVVIGDGNVLREFVTIHRARGEGQSTVVGNSNMLMAYCHVGHNCSLGSNITMANAVGVSGHVVIEDNVVLGGMTGIHQNLRIGKYAMVGGFSKVVQDVPPFAMADGRPARVCDINVIGLRRNDVSAKVRSDIRQAYKLLYRSNLNTSQALEAIEKEVDPSAEMQYLLDFIKNIRHGTRGRQLEAPRR